MEKQHTTYDGFVNLTADTLISEILLDVLLQKELASRKARILPIYWGFSHELDKAGR